jgi:hypothetical protein
MKQMAHTIRRHAQAHRALLAQRRAETTLSEPQAQVILRRIEGVLARLPAALQQAHERIIGGRQVPNADKLLSLSEPDVQVLKRGKAGAAVEFGHKLWLGETREGLIVDFALLPEVKADPALVLPAVRRLVKDLKLKVQAVWGDRGLFSQANARGLAQRAIKCGLCPRDPAELHRRLAEEAGFRAGLRRRGGTEARIAIFKASFVGSPCLTKRFAPRALAVSWAVLAHNLWLLARLQLQQDRHHAPPVAQAA